MKTVLIVGSPRVSSDSSKIAEKAISAIGSSGNEVKRYVINDIKARGCQACYSCKGKTETCVIKDDLAQSLAACQEADYIIVTSPVYIGEITAQLKIWIDRTFAWYKPDFITSSNPSRLQPGKKLLFVLTQGNPDPATYQANIVDRYLSYFKTHGMKTEALVAVIPHDQELSAKAVEKYSADAEKIVRSI
jgi:multimeric flavodoxin WrbA